MHILPPGEYYIGDPCYTMNDKDWTDFVNLLAYESEEVIVFKNQTIVIGCTEYGDGVYSDINSNNEFGVDSGMLAILPTSLISKDISYIIDKYAKFVKFDSPIACNITQGVFTFGNVVINTSMD